MAQPTEEKNATPPVSDLQSMASKFIGDGAAQAPKQSLINSSGASSSAPAAPVSGMQKISDTGYKGASGASIALHLADGNYMRAGLETGQYAAMNSATIQKATENLTKAVHMAAPALQVSGQVAKRLPVVGGAVTVALASPAIAARIIQGDYKGAALEAGATVAEATVNTLGGGLIGAGDAAREGVRAGYIAATSDEKSAPNKSGLRALGERGYKEMEKAALENDPLLIAKKQQELVDKETVLQKNITLGDKTVPLIDALRNPATNGELKDTLLKMQGQGHDFTSQIKMIDEVSRLEGVRQKRLKEAATLDDRRMEGHAAPGHMPMGA